VCDAGRNQEYQRSQKEFVFHMTIEAEL
jgi:hypothetical protein